MILKATSWTMLFFLLAGSVLGGGFNTVAKGPMHFTGQTPLQTMRLDIVPTRHKLLGYGETELSLYNSWTNRWNNSPEFLVDVEIIQNIFEFSIGLGNSTEAGFSLPVITRTGGHLDRFIMDFHNVFRLEQAGRDQYPTNDMSFRFYSDDTGEWTVLLDENDQRTILGDLSLFSRTQIYHGQGWLKSMMLTVLFRFPTSNDRTYYGSAGTDAAISLASFHHLRPFYIYTTAGYGMFGSGSIPGADLRSYQWTLFGAVEWPITGNYSLIIQEMSNSGVAKTYYDFNRPTHELVIGAKHYLTSRLMLEYGVMENLFNFENSVDLGFNFAVTYRP